MTAYNLYNELIVQGFSLSVNGGKLDLAPSSRLTDNLRAQIRTYKADLMDLVAANYEKPLFYHLVDCMDCDFEAARYCPDIFKVGRGYNVMLSYFDDALARREALLTQVIRARISGRKVFLSLDHDNTPTPQQKPVKPLTYGIDDSERPFVNHIMACKQCRPRSALYCADGLKLKANA